MNTTFKITRELLGLIRKDLARPHAFAAERVGFISVGFSAAGKDLYVLAREYRPVADDDYVPDRTVAVMMGPEAIRKALEWAMRERVGLFHVHSHGGQGCPGFSGIDSREQAKFVPNFFDLAPQCAHGALVLSNDSAFGHIWVAANDRGQKISQFVEVGAPQRRWGCHG